jgi:hypothetical protein
MIAGASSSAQLFKERDLLHVGSHDTPTSESLSTYITPNKNNINDFQLNVPIFCGDTT